MIILIQAEKLPQNFAVFNGILSRAFSGGSIYLSSQHSLSFFPFSLLVVGEEHCNQQRISNHYTPTMKSALLRPCSAPLLLDPQDLHRNRASSVRHASTISCSSRNEPYIPKLEPFTRTKFERMVKDPPLIEKSEKELADYCSTLEGDQSYSCWQAYFELKDLERELPKADVERLILETGGVKSLIGCLHGIAIMHKLKKNGFNLVKDVKSEEDQRHCPIPDGLPKSADELMEEEQARMPDSPYTRLLRSKGRFPAWYSPAPDHQTD